MTATVPALRRIAARFPLPLGEGQGEGLPAGARLPVSGTASDTRGPLPPTPLRQAQGRLSPRGRGPSASHQPHHRVAPDPRPSGPPCRAPARTGPSWPCPGGMDSPRDGIIRSVPAPLREWVLHLAQSARWAGRQDPGGAPGRAPRCGTRLLRRFRNNLQGRRGARFQEDPSPQPPFDKLRAGSPPGGGGIRRIAAGCYRRRLFQHCHPGPRAGVQSHGQMPCRATLGPGSSPGRQAGERRQARERREGSDRGMTAMVPALRRIAARLPLPLGEGQGEGSLAGARTLVSGFTLNTTPCHPGPRAGVQSRPSTIFAVGSGPRISAPRIGVRGRSLRPEGDIEGNGDRGKAIAA